MLPSQRRDVPERLDTSSAAHLRENPRRHRRSQKARSSAARPRDGFRRSQTHQGRIVTWSSRQTALDRQANGSQNRKNGALKAESRCFGPLE